MNHETRGRKPKLTAMQKAAVKRSPKSVIELTKEYNVSNYIIYGILRTKTL